MVLAVALLAGALAFFLSATRPDRYTADATILFREASFDQQLFGGGGGFVIDPDREAATNVGLVSLDEIAQLTAEDIEGEDKDSIESAVTIDSDGASDLVSIEATSEDPESAAEIANTFAENYVKFRRGADRAQVANARRLVERDLARLPDEERDSEAGQALARQISQLKSLEALQTGNAEVVQTAEVPSSRSSPKPVRNTIIGMFLGLPAGILAAAFLERFDRRLRELDDFEDTFGVPLLVSIPYDKRVARGDGDVRRLHQDYPQAFHMLHTKLRYFNVDGEVRTVLLTSPHTGDGKSTISWGLAASAAASGTRALLIETDLHKPTLASGTRTVGVPGLSEYLSGQESLEDVVRRVPIATEASSDSNGTEGPAVHVIFSGLRPPNPAELLESDRMADLIRDARADYDFIVIDTPPILQAADAVPLLRVDGVIEIGSIGKTSADEARQLGNQLRTFGSSVLGVIANQALSRASRQSVYSAAPYP